MAYRGIGKSWLSLVGALLLIGLLAFVCLIWWLVPCIGWFTGLGMLMTLLAAVSPMVAPVIVLEQQSVGGSLRRSWSLVRRRFWPVLGYVFVLYLFSMLIVSGPSTLINILLAGVFDSINDPFSGLLIRTIIQSVVQLISILIYYPLQMTAFTLIYFDLRVRTEGFDLTLLTVDATDQSGLDQAMNTSHLTNNERLISGTDLGNFAILTLIVGGLYIFLVAFIMGGAMFLPTLFR